jgi:hypothetical protein
MGDHRVPATGRDTDPIGGWIFSPHQLGERPHVEEPAGRVDRRLGDPGGVTVPPSDTVPPPIEGHWPYYTDEHYNAAIRELVQRLRPAVSRERLGVASAGHGPAAEMGRPPPGVTGVVRNSAPGGTSRIPPSGHGGCNRRVLGDTVVTP